MKPITKDMPEFVLDKVLDFDLEEIYMYCAVNCIQKYCQLHKDKKTNRR